MSSISPFKLPPVRGMVIAATAHRAILRAKQNIVIPARCSLSQKTWHWVRYVHSPKHWHLQVAWIWGHWNKHVHVHTGLYAVTLLCPHTCTHKNVGRAGSLASLRFRRGWKVRRENRMMERTCSLERNRTGCCPTPRLTEQSHAT